MKPVTDTKIEALSAKLDAFLDLRDAELLPRYLEYRDLLRTLDQMVSVEPLILPLFPERRFGVILKKAAYELQGNLFSKKDISRQPPGSTQEYWFPTKARVTELSVLDKYSYRFEFEYPDKDNKTFTSAIEYGVDGMHFAPWYWNEAELKATFAKGSLLPCYVSEENSYRYKVFEPYA